MNKINWQILKHQDLSCQDYHNIASLKDQHWPHGTESQIHWMEKYLKENDIHLIGSLPSAPQCYAAVYATISNIIVNTDSSADEKCLGIGCVCVDKSIEHQGFGLALMQKATEIINSEKKTGYLLCKPPLVAFYEKCGWNIVHFENAVVENSPYSNMIMSNIPVKAGKMIFFDRNF